MEEKAVTLRPLVFMWAGVRFPSLESMTAWEPERFFIIVLILTKYDFCI